MRSLKFAGVVACGLAISVTTATAAPQVLDDAALDGVVAGFDFFAPGTSSYSGFGSERPTLGSIFPIFAPVVALERTIEVERVENSQSTTGSQGLVSTSETTGIPAQEFLANPPPPPLYVYPTFRRFAFQ